jgi:hypothetical protein
VAQDVGPEFKAQYCREKKKRRKLWAGCWQLIPVILAIWKAEIRRIAAMKIVCVTPSPK